VLHCREVRADLVEDRLVRRDERLRLCDLRVELVDHRLQLRLLQLRRRDRCLQPLQLLLVLGQLLLIRTDAVGVLIGNGLQRTTEQRARGEQRQPKFDDRGDAPSQAATPRQTVRNLRTPR
jgi:hypothetical protein